MKAKPLWTVDGLGFHVQAWTKMEAKELIRKKLREAGEIGRFSVPILNPKRIKQT